MNYSRTIIIPIFVTIIISSVTVFSYTQLQTVSELTQNKVENYTTNLLILDSMVVEINNMKVEILKIHHFDSFSDDDYKKSTQLLNNMRMVIVAIDKLDVNKIIPDDFKKLSDDLFNKLLSLNVVFYENDTEKTLLLLFEIDDILDEINILLIDENKIMQKNFINFQDLSYSKYSYANQLLIMVIVISIFLSIVMSFWMYKISVLRKQDTQKTEFASMITHELKTPLSPILTACVMLNQEILGTLNASQKEEIQRIQRNASSLLKIITDILDVQKLGMKKLTFTNGEFDVLELFDELLSDYKEIVHEKRIKLFVHINEKTIIVSDKNRIRQVLDNLIKNSLDFVKYDIGIIDVGIYLKKNEIIFFVKDNGRGIERRNQSELFKKFYQVDTSHTRKHGGTGLGLSICQGIVEALGGVIWLKSQLGSGTEIFFSIPLKQKIF